MKLRFAPEAVDDLARLRAFIAEKNPAAAQRTARDVLLGLEKLKAFPELGLRVQRAPDPDRIRDVFIGSYVVRYLVGDQDIVVLRVWHGKENERNA